MNEILDFLNAKDNGSPQVFLGDFNTGPSFPEFEIAAELPEHYQEILDDGYGNPNADSATPFCTYCPTENLITDLGFVEN